MGLSDRRVDKGLFGFLHIAVAISIDGLKGNGGGGGIGAVGLGVGLFQAGVTDAGVQALDAAGSDVGVNTVVGTSDAVVSHSGLSG